MVRLIFDEMARRTATWCRIFGVDSVYAKDFSDSKILKTAKEENRIVVTRDGELAGRCRAADVKVVLLKTDKFEDQLNQLKSELGDIFTFPENTRCPACNGELDIVDKDEVKDRVIDNVYEQNEKFWICKNCGKIYWEGSHWKNITRIFKSIK